MGFEKIVSINKTFLAANKNVLPYGVYAKDCYVSNNPTFTHDTAQQKYSLAIVGSDG